ncbi:LysR substrate-binding domain-containing protein [Burkholderia sp. Bp9143]|uniref:LysR substrate-binding domain-containing protein n=1 Tax=Burkholderia sp. Bp9143 TaxID=2184574 RepID=UPI001627A754|nr:LysR substrate-binding domain-containing protein [Burkholderia sp. Bp9143]
MPLITALQRFRKSFLEVTISLQVRPSAAVYEWVTGGRCDIGIASPKSGFLGVEEEPLMAWPGVVAAPASQRFARLKRPIVPANLDGEPFLALALEDGTRHVIDQIFADSQVHLHPDRDPVRRNACMREEVMSGLRALLHADNSSTPLPSVPSHISPFSDI